MPRDGSVGTETFTQVEKLVKRGKTKTEAFAEIAAETGRNQGTVAANYYRVARKLGAVKPRAKRAPASTARPTTKRSRRTRGSNTARSDIDRLTADLVKSVTELANAVKAEQAEVASLRARLADVRNAIA